MLKNADGDAPWLEEATPQNTRNTRKWSVRYSSSGKVLAQI